MTDKRQLIFNSTLKLICERGFHDSPMSIIAKDANVSVGIIYHYFDNKEDLIESLYENLKSDFLRKIVEGSSADFQPKENLRKYWMNTIDYYLNHPDEINFLEQYDHSPSLKETSIEEYMNILSPFFKTIEKGTNEGIIKELHIEVLISLTIDVAISLSKKHIQGRIILDDDALELAFQSCWAAIEK